MSKKIAILLLVNLLLLVIGCSLHSEKFYLEDKYYGNNDFIEVDNLTDENYILYVYNSFCSFPKPCADVFQEFMQENNVVFLSMPIDKYKTTKLYSEVKYAPTIIIVESGKIIAYLDAESDDDIDKYQDVQKFSEWISKYIYLEKGV